jgi:hypothetical protein
MPLVEISVAMRTFCNGRLTLLAEAEYLLRKIFGDESTEADDGLPEAVVHVNQKV